MCEGLFAQPMHAREGVLPAQWLQPLHNYSPKWYMPDDNVDVHLKKDALFFPVVISHEL